MLPILFAISGGMKNMRWKKIIYINIYDTSCLQHATDYKENRKENCKNYVP